MMVQKNSAPKALPHSAKIQMPLQAPLQMHHNQMHHKKKMSLASQMMDQDGKGFLTPLEMKCRSYDKDGDGKFDISEVKSIVKDLQKQERRAAKMTRIAMASVILSLIIVAVMFGVVYGGSAAAIKASKESHVASSTESSASGVEVGDKDTVQVKYYVDLDGNPISTDPLHDADGNLVTVKGEGVATAASKKEHRLSSRIPDRYLAELLSFTVTIDTGATVFATVHGFSRVVDAYSHCGSYVVLRTSMGNFTLDDDQIFVDGLGGVKADGTSGGSRRRLSPEHWEHHVQHGRRLGANKLTGFYNKWNNQYISLYELECTWLKKKRDIRPPKPTLPISLKTTVSSSCKGLLWRMGVKQDLCSSGLLSASSKPGVTDDGLFLESVTDALVTKSFSVAVSTLPNHPYAKKVTIVNRSGEEGAASRFEYVLWDATRTGVDFGGGNNDDDDDDGNFTKVSPSFHRFHCSSDDDLAALAETTSKTMLNFDDFSVTYLGMESDPDAKGQRLRKWKMEHKTNEGDGYLFWDDVDTQAPRRRQDLRLGADHTTFHNFQDALSDTDVDLWLGHHVPGETVSTIQQKATCLDEAQFSVDDGFYAVPTLAQLDPFSEDADVVEMYSAVMKQVGGGTGGGYWARMAGVYNGPTDKHAAPSDFIDAKGDSVQTSSPPAATGGAGARRQLQSSVSLPPAGTGWGQITFNDGIQWFSNVQAPGAGLAFGRSLQYKESWVVAAEGCLQNWLPAKPSKLDVCANGRTTLSEGRCGSQDFIMGGAFDLTVNGKVHLGWKVIDELNIEKASLTIEPGCSCETRSVRDGWRQIWTEKKWVGDCELTTYDDGKYLCVTEGAKLEYMVPGSISPSTYCVGTAISAGWVHKWNWSVCRFEGGIGEAFGFTQYKKRVWVQNYKKVEVCRNTVVESTKTVFEHPSPQKPWLKSVLHVRPGTKRPGIKVELETMVMREDPVSNVWSWLKVHTVEILNYETIEFY